MQRKMETDSISLTLHMRHILMSLDILSSQSLDSYKLYLCVCVCYAFMAYISFTMGQILIKLSENVGTLVQLIVLKFHCVTPLEHCVNCVKGVKFSLHFYAF